VSGAALRLVPGELDWREVLETAIRPEFRVAVYEAAPDDRWLYGPHCAVEGCELPIHRPVSGPGSVHVCNGHRHNFDDNGGGDWRGWLAAAGPLRTQRRRCPTYRLAVSGLMEAELSYGLQCWHDGEHVVVASKAHWGGAFAGVGAHRRGVGARP
jgi:hypothetical protein